MATALGWGWDGSTYVGSPAGQPYETVFRPFKCGDPLLRAAGYGDPEVGDG